MTPAHQRRKVGIGLLGSGIVGEAIQDILLKDLQGRVAEDLELDLRRIYTRRPQGKKWFARRPDLFTTDPGRILDDPEIAIVVEALGHEQPADLPLFRDYILRAFANGKSVVTSDKAVLARYGDEIWPAAVRAGRQIRFEACVGGGIPIIRSLCQSFAVEEPEAVFGIVNGTSNYVLSQMEKTAVPYGEALKQAQKKGYAETNPEADVSGRDAEAKLILLAAVAFGLRVQPGTIWRKGIEQIHAVDFRYAGRTGASTIKQLAVAKRQGDRVQLFVSPVLIGRDQFLAGIDGATNAICFRGKRSGAEAAARERDYVFVGPGAGGGPTAVAVLGDVCELARLQPSANGLAPLMQPGRLEIDAEDEIDGSFYVRFIVRDRAGIVGDIGQTFGRLRVNISEIWQLRHGEEERRALVESFRLSADPAQILPFVMTLEHATVGQIRRAMDHIRSRDYIVTDPVWFPIWSEK